MPDPIGHLPVNEQAARDAAAGPPVGGTPRSSHPWPDPPKPSTKYRGNGGSWPDGMHFRCATCGTLEPDSIIELTRHTVSMHHRGPYDTERIPL